jgi:hypothetical protein
VLRKGLDGTVQYRAEQTEHDQHAGKRRRGSRGRARLRHGIRNHLVRRLRDVDGVLCLEGIGLKQPAQIADDRDHQRRLEVIERRVHLRARRRHVGERLGRDARLEGLERAARAGLHRAERRRGEGVDELGGLGSHLQIGQRIAVGRDPVDSDEVVVVLGGKLVGGKLDGAVTIRGIPRSTDGRVRALLRIGEAHHQDEEEESGEPRRGPDAAHRAAPCRVMIWHGEAHHQGDEEVARKSREIEARLLPRLVVVRARSTRHRLGRAHRARRADRAHDALAQGAEIAGESEHGLVGVGTARAGLGRGRALDAQIAWSARLAGRAARRRRERACRAEIANGRAVLRSMRPGKACSASRGRSRLRHGVGCASGARAARGICRRSLVRVVGASGACREGQAQGSSASQGAEAAARARRARDRAQRGRIGCSCAGRACGRPRRRVVRAREAGQARRWIKEAHEVHVLTRRAGDAGGARGRVALALGAARAPSCAEDALAALRASCARAGDGIELAVLVALVADVENVVAA